MSSRLRMRRRAHVAPLRTRQPRPDRNRPHRTDPAAAEDAGDAGFTLIELLVVIAILGLLIALVAPAVIGQLGNAKVKIANQSIERIGQILDLYKLDVGSYPGTDDGLQALVTKPADADNWNGPYVKANQVPVDPWNHPYSYRSPSSRDGHDYDLCSAGPTGNADGSGQICNK